MIKIENLSPGQIVYDVQTRKMGNTTIRTKCLYRVKIISVDVDKQEVMASWNNNSPQKYRGAKFNWRKDEPLMIRSLMGYARLATREEIKAHKENSK